MLICLCLPVSKSYKRGHTLTFFPLNLKITPDLLQYGYCSMEQRQYEEAIVAFKEYLNVDSDIYWYLIEYSNNENYSRKKVKECLEKCMLLQKKY